jgi:archaellum component FlaF (FlaF/FlaG flagellin family)
MRQRRTWHETTAGTDSGAVATHAAETSVAHFVTQISGHTDTDSIITVKDGSTIIWQTKIDVSVKGFDFSYDLDEMLITPGTAVSGTIVTSTSDAQVNLIGYSIP